MHYTVYMRNNWSTDWVKIQQGSVEWNGTNEQLADSCTITVQMMAARLLETDTANLYRMYSEVRVDETDHNDATFIRFHGFVVDITPSIETLTLAVVDFLGLLGMMRCDVPASSADTIRIGTDETPAKMVPITEGGETRYVMDGNLITGFPQAYTGGIPNGSLSNRRIFKEIVGIRDSGANADHPEDPDYYPEHLLPQAKWTVGTDLMTYIQFIGYTPLGDITCDLVVVYVENTNQIEDIIVGALSVALPHGPGLVAGVHYNNVSADYFVRTIWPSLITVNEWKWKETDGTLAQMIDKLFSQNVPPNYRPFWDHSLMMLRVQYCELLPFNTSTSYYVAGSYPYGRIVTAPPAAEVDGDYVDITQVDPGRQIARSTDLFKSKITVVGINEWPENLVQESMVTTLLSEWAGGGGGTWALDGAVKDILDNDIGTECKIWNTNHASPDKAFTDKYHPVFHIDLGSEQIVDVARLWMPDSRQPNWPFGLRVECHNDPSFLTYDPAAPWEPMHPDLWDKQCQPYELVEVSGNFLRSICRFILISFRPAKINIRFTYAGGLSGMEFLRSPTVSGKAYVVGATPGAGYTLIRGTSGVTGSWYQKAGVSAEDGEIVVLLPALYNQLCSRSTIANKLVAGHRADIKENRSLANTNECAFEAARILSETLRDARRFNVTGLSLQAIKKFRTALVTDDFFGVTRNALIENLGSKQPGTVDIQATAYGYSNASRAGAWTSEAPDAL